MDHQLKEIDHIHYKDVGISQRFFLELSGRYALRKKWLGWDFSEMRTYAPWDDRSKIDWKTTAKKNTLYVKEYEQEGHFQLLFWLGLWDFWWRNLWTKDIFFWKVAKIFTLLALIWLRSWDDIRLFGSSLYFLGTWSSQDHFRLMMDDLSWYSTSRVSYLLGGSHNSDSYSTTTSLLTGFLKEKIIQRCFVVCGVPYSWWEHELEFLLQHNMLVYIACCPIEEEREQDQHIRTLWKKSIESSWWAFIELYDYTDPVDALLKWI